MGAYRGLRVHISGLWVHLHPEIDIKLHPWTCPHYFHCPRDRWSAIFISKFISQPALISLTISGPFNIPTLQPDMFMDPKVGSMIPQDLSTNCSIGSMIQSDPMVKFDSRSRIPLDPTVIFGIGSWIPIDP